jgi:F-type H+-transporting ATPase subunit a
MGQKSLKSLLVAAFSLIIVLAPFASFANEGGGEGHAAGKEEAKPVFDANEVIFEHVLDAHQFHFLSYKGSDGEEHHVGIPLPVILYSPERGLSTFMSSKFHHGHETHDGYAMLTAHSRKEMGLDEKKFSVGQIIPLDASGRLDESVKVYDVSLTRNVVQMLIALILLAWILIKMANKYKTGVGTTKAPTGMQNAVEPVITFIRDEVAKPNLGHSYEKFLPYLLTVFFFILINNIFGLIPGTANVTGNIAFTVVLGVVAFIIITVKANKHYWAHVVNPPVPFGIKFIMVPVEILSIFTKPFALIIRLFANMLAGHIIIICLVSLIFIFGGLSRGIGWGFSPVSIAFATFIYLIEVLVAFIQAFIFTNLTAVFIGQAIEDHNHHGGPGHDDAVII